MKAPLENLKLQKLELLTLAQCLAFDQNETQTQDLRQALIKIGPARILDLAVQLRLQASLALAVNERNLLPTLPKLTLPDGRITVTQSLENILHEHHQRRAAMKQRLLEIATAFNGLGIIPLVLKGARSLVTDSPAWRSLRDLDILVSGENAVHAQAKLFEMEYAPLPELAVKADKHHFVSLFRADMPGWVEIHHHASNHFAERLLPTSSLVAHQNTTTVNADCKLAVLDSTDHILHGLVHHHFAHAIYRDEGTLDLKGLYEFAADIAGLDEAGRDNLVERAKSHPRLFAALDLWLAAAADLFQMPLLQPFELHPDATRLWHKALDRMTGTRKVKLPYVGYGDEVALSFAKNRLNRVLARPSLLARCSARIKILNSFLRRPKD